MRTILTKGRANRCDCGRPSARPPQEQTGAPQLSNGCEWCIRLESEQGKEHRAEAYKMKPMTSHNLRQSEDRESRRDPLQGILGIGAACDEFFAGRGLRPEPVDRFSIESNELAA